MRRFHDRVDAGQQLAEKLVSSLEMERERQKDQGIIVLGIPRGGVILADIIAKKFSADFDIVVPRKMGAPANEELAIGAVMADGTSYINDYIVSALHVPPNYLEEEKKRQADEIMRRLSIYRKTSNDYRARIEGKVAILVDDGIATGATVIASARWLRKQKPGELVIAVPVGPAKTIELLRQEADHVEVLEAPEDFGAVGQFYDLFETVTDEQVIEVMRARNL
jgi:putative phosphoribosyl transferase